MATLLDLVFIEAYSNSRVQKCKPYPFFSDHSMVECILSIPREDMVQHTTTLQKTKGLDTEQLVNLMNLQGLDEITNLNDLISSFNRISGTALDQMAPFITKTITIRHRNSWFIDKVHEENVG